jgi:hypothetical protein
MSSEGVSIRDIGFDGCADFPVKLMGERAAESLQPIDPHFRGARSQGEQLGAQPLIEAIGNGKLGCREPPRRVD